MVLLLRLCNNRLHKCNSNFLKNSFLRQCLCDFISHENPQISKNEEKNESEVKSPGLEKNEVEIALKLQLEPKNKLSVAAKLYLKFNAEKFAKVFPDIVDECGNILAIQNDNKDLQNNLLNESATSELTKIENFVEIPEKDIKIDPLLLLLEERDDKQSMHWWSNIKFPLVDKKDYKRLHAKKGHELVPLIFRYGTADPTEPKSDVACQGCGALLHCQDSNAAGFIPSEKFKMLQQAELRLEDCQKCYLLKNHNIDLRVNTPADNINRTVAPIRSFKSLLILVVDLYDFPCSIHPGLIDLVGWNKKVVIVGNKFDLIPKDRNNYEERIANSLKQEVLKLGFAERNILHVALISAKTGYGVEELISKLYKFWEFKGDIYMVGSINAGKTSLFNVLLHSDLCKTKAIDYIRAATTSIWPGTTVDLIRFPLLKPSPYRTALRLQRLKRDDALWREREALRKIALYQSREQSFASPTGFVGQTFSNSSTPPVFTTAFNYPALDSIGTKLLMDESITETRIAERTKKGAIDPEDKDFTLGRWLYDTPGTVCSGQFLDKLQTEELHCVLPNVQPLPQTWIMKPENVLLIGGLVKVEYLEGGHPIMVTVVVSDGLPIYLLWLSTFQKFYDKHVGTKKLRVPYGDKTRLSEFPAWEPTDVEIKGQSWTESVADIVLSGMGWICVTAGRGLICKFRVYTPGGQGCSLRKPSLTPYLVVHRGKRKPESAQFEVRPLRIYTKLKQ